MSEVDIGNLALSFLGDEATVTGLTPPDGSEQAEHLARFYPFARDMVLEAFPFFTRRGALALRTDSYNGWQYAYDRPSNCLKFLAVLPPQAADEYSLGYMQLGVRQNADGGYVEGIPAGFNTYTPVPFRTEISAEEEQVILTNMPEAHGRWSVRVTNTALFSPTCKIAIAKLLASFAAGPIYKGDEGARMSVSMLQHYQAFMAQATVNAANETREEVAVATPWIAGR